MKNKLLFCGVTIVIIASFFINFNVAMAVGNAYFQQATTVSLTVDGVSTDFTIDAESDADSVVVDASTVKVTISAGQRFTFISSGKKKLANDGGFNEDCASTQSSLVITVSTPKTITITPNSATCTTGTTGSTGAVASSGGGGSVTTATPTPTPSLSPTPTPLPSSVPGAVTLAIPKGVPKDFNLKEGDVFSATSSDDPDVYIVNEWGYKRLFLNPVIFNFYGHLGGFSKVKKSASSTRDAFVTSGLFRNCETNDQKVYGVEVSGEDTGTLHWVNTTGEQAVKDDLNFFKKVFCINNNEFKWYKLGTSYTSVNQIPAYSRKTTVSAPKSTSTPTVAVSGKLKVISSIPWLNVRDTFSTKGKIINKVLPGQVFNYVDVKSDWYKIQKDGKDFGWVFGQYISTL